MPVLQVNLSDPSDVRTSINILKRHLDVAAQGPRSSSPADSQEPSTQAMAVLRQKKVWPFLEQVAELEVPEFSLPELGAHLDMPSNRVSSLRAILAKLEQRLDIELFLLAPSRATDTQGNPRYQMPAAIKEAIKAEGKKLPEMSRIAKKLLRDMIDHSNLFAGLDSRGQKECLRMSCVAIDLLWDRTGAVYSDCGHYETELEHIDFLKRHPRLLDCVKHMFVQNTDRTISKLRLSPGQSAAMMYMMASSASDADAYRKGNPPSEKQLSWEYWKKAEEFWSLLAADDDQLVAVVRALHSLADENSVHGTSHVRKLAVVTKAWRLFQADEKITKKALTRDYRENTNDLSRRERAAVGGIDLG
jgi:hypothetical protein